MSSSMNWLVILYVLGALLLIAAVVVIIVVVVVKSSGRNAAQSAPPTGELPYELRERKNIALCIVLSFITFGIYQLFWIYSLCKKIRLLAGADTNIAGEYLLLIFIPFYNIYWGYTRGKQMHESMLRRGIAAGDSSIAYLVLNIFELNIVTYALIQNDLNKVADAA